MQDGFYNGRKWLLDRIAYCSLLVFGYEDISFEEVQKGAIDQKTHTNRNLDNAQDLDTLLDIAKECF